MDYICKSLLNIFLISTSWGAGRLTQSNKFQKSSYSEGEKGVGGGQVGFSKQAELSGFE